MRSVRVELSTIKQRIDQKQAHQPPRSSRERHTHVQSNVKSKGKTPTHKDIDSRSEQQLHHAAATINPAFASDHVLTFSGKIDRKRPHDLEPEEAQPPKQKAKVSPQEHYIGGQLDARQSDRPSAKPAGEFLRCSSPRAMMRVHERLKRSRVPASVGAVSLQPACSVLHWRGASAASQSYP